MYRNLRVEMARRDLNKRTLAKMLDMPYTTLAYKLEKPGRIKISEGTDIRDKFFPGVSVEDLFKWED